MAWRKENGFAYHGKIGFGKRRQKLPLRPGQNIPLKVDVWDAHQCQLIREIKRRVDDGEPWSDIGRDFNKRGECNGDGDGDGDAFDILETRNNPRAFFNPATIDTLHDFNRDERVDAIDTLIARNNRTWAMTELELIDLSGSKTAESRETVVLSPPTSIGPLPARPPHFAGGSPELEETVAHDVVLRRVLDARNSSREVSSAKMVWLYEVEQMETADQPSKKGNPVEEAVDRLLATTQE